MQFLTFFSVWLGLCASSHALPTPDEGALDTRNPDTADTASNPEGQDSTSPKINVFSACPYPIYLLSVSSTSSPLQIIYPYTSWAEKEYFDPKTGIAIKIAKNQNDFYTAGAPTLIFGYTLNLNEGNIYYSLSTLNADPFGYEAVTGANCPPIVGPTATTKACTITDLYVRIC